MYREGSTETAVVVRPGQLVRPWVSESTLGGRTGGWGGGGGGSLGDKGWSQHDHSM